MISAFGVLHTQVAKGLPSALRAGKAQGDYAKFRQAAHEAGQMSGNAKAFARNPFGPADSKKVQTYMYHQGKAYRGLSRRLVRLAGKKK